MKRLKKTELEKLSIDMSTIRILSDDEQKQAAGGITGQFCPDPGPRTQTCSVRTPGCY